MWPDKKCQMSVKVAQKWFHKIKFKILTPLQKLPKNVGDLGKLIGAKGFEKLPKVQKNRPIWSHWSQAPFCLFSSFQQTLQFLQQIYVINGHPVYCTGIRTHDLSNKSRQP